MNSFLMRYRIYIFLILIGAIASTSVFIVRNTILRSPQAQSFDQTACLDQGGAILTDPAECKGIPVPMNSPDAGAGSGELPPGTTDPKSGVINICCLPHPTETPPPPPVEPEKPTEEPPPVEPTKSEEPPKETQAPEPPTTTKEPSEPTATPTTTRPSPSPEITKGTGGGGGGDNNVCVVPEFTATTRMNNSCVNCSQ